VTYAGAFAGADLVYTLAPGGLQERIVLARPTDTSLFGFVATATDLKLVPNEVGAIDVLDPEGLAVATLPTPVAYDASPDPIASTGTVTLTDHADGGFGLDIAVDPEFLVSASYPVVIDPAWNDAPNRDGYTNQSSPGTSYESNDYLQADSGKRTYIRFNTDSIETDELIVYDAQLMMYPTSAGAVTGGIAAKRVLDPWPAGGTLNWNNQPAIGSTVFDEPTNAPGGGQDWWTWDVTELYQHYLDTADTYNTHWTNLGVALTATNPKTFYAVDATLQNSDPVLYVTYNRLPYAPTLDAPTTGYLTESESLTLSVNQVPSDPNGDDVMVSFQISDNGTSWTGSHLVFESPYDDRKSFTVPAGVLLDGQTYYWRAVSRDVCDPGTGAMCSLTDGAGTVRDPKTSGVRSFTVQLEHLGTDHRWAMWSHDVGSDMSLQVNQSNGNLFLDVPIASYATPIGPMDVSLAYNSLEDAGFGMGAGWDIAVGPRSSAGGLPTKLFRLDTSADADVKIRFQGGRTLYFPHNYGAVWGGTSAMSGIVTKNANGTWTYAAADGGTYGFDTNAASPTGAELLTAKPASSGASASNKEFTYTYDVNLRLDAVTDPLGRKVNLVWDANGKLQYIRAADYGANQRVLTYANGKIATITTSVSDNLTPPTSHDEVLTFRYHATSGLVNEVLDAVQSAGAGDGWDVVYGTGTFTRVQSVTPPSSGSPATSPTTPQPWRFGYVDKNPATQNVAFACLTDPRNTVSITCDPDMGTADDANQTQTQFNDAGLPVKVAGAIVGSFRPVSTYVFDNHNNLICSRTPEANALGTESCSSASDQDTGGLSTVYDYENTAPYRLVSVTHPAAASGTFPRLRETYAYDEGSSFNGLWAEAYRNTTLDGSPHAEQQWNDLDQSWTAGGSPPSLADPDGNNWGLRLSGFLDISDLGGGKKYKFRVFSDDGVRLSVEGKTILDCFGQTQDAGTSNCGTGVDVGTFLWGTEAPIRIEYADLTGVAQLTVKWDQGNGTWITIPGYRLFPDLGLVTSKTYEKLQSGGGAPDVWQERWTFPDDDAKSRRLQASHIREDLSGATSHVYRTDYVYGATYGLLQTETANAQDAANDVVTTYTYENGVAPGAWGLPAGSVVSCISRTVVDTQPASDDITTDIRCDRAGRTTQQILNVDAVSGTPQVAQPRTTQTIYDSLGRPTRTLEVETGAEQITVYDVSGRVQKTRTLVSGTTYTERGYVYDHAGRLKTEAIANPTTGVVNLTTPWASVAHLYDLADNEIQLTDERGKVWTAVYDALNRVSSQTSPLGAVTTTTYQLGSGLNRVLVYTPGATASGGDTGAVTTTDMDVLGRKTSEQLEGYDPTTYAYDVLGNGTSMTAPTGIRTSSTYSGLSELLTTTEFSQSGGTPATTTNTYDGSGRLVTVDGPRAGADEDVMSYEYDVFGRLTKSITESVTIPGGTNAANTALTYNDAGERIKIDTKLTNTVTVSRQFGYDAAGRQTTMIDAKGTTTTTYNKAGWVTLVDDPRTTNVNMTYDYLGRLVCRHTATCTSLRAGPNDSPTTRRAT
jgi:YD repeat-containing protein